MKKIRVLLADDHLLFRAGLVSLFTEQPDFAVVGQAGSGLQAVAMARALSPDLTLLDVRMPGLSGLDALKQIRAEDQAALVVMLTASEDDDDLFDAVRSGAQGYLLKNTPPNELFSQLHAVMRGEAAISGRLAARLLGELAGRHSADRGLAVLTQRESDVLRLVAVGASNRDIAGQLTITENTVKKHLQSILEKLHVQNRTQAAAYAVREGMDSSEG
jgi:DNA-binding NarL/FixJ family response regulator